MRVRLSSKGFSIIEVIVAVVIFTFAILGMTTTSNFVSRQMQIARRDMRMASATQHKIEQLLAGGYSGITSGSGTVDGFPMTWSVSGTNPKVLVVVASTDTTESAKKDTVITAVAQPQP